MPPENEGEEAAPLSGEEIADVKEEIAEISEEIGEAETPQELQALDARLERILTWATQNLLGPVAELTAELRESNRLKAEKLAAETQALAGAIPGPVPEPGAEAEATAEPLPPPEQIQEPEMEPEPEPEKKTRTIQRL